MEGGGVGENGKEGRKGRWGFYKVGCTELTNRQTDKDRQGQSDRGEKRSEGRGGAKIRGKE